MVGVNERLPLVDVDGHVKRHASNQWNDVDGPGADPGMGAWPAAPTRGRAIYRFRVDNVNASNAPSFG